MQALFVHQNFPGQYAHLAARLAAQPGNRVLALGDASRLRHTPAIPGVRRIGYPSPKGPSPSAHPYLRTLDGSVRRGQIVAQAALALKSSGFRPDLVCVHPGWGEGLFLRDVFPDARMLGYFEFYYSAVGSDVGFDPEFPSAGDETAMRLRMRNTHLLATMMACDRGLAPTRWQQAQIPEPLRAITEVIHDGIDTAAVRPGATAFVELRRAGLRLTARDEVVTYVARNLEPYRGFHVFMRALPALLARRPNARVIIVGGDQVSYSPPPRRHASYRRMLLEELGGRLDLSRVHFVGKLPYATYLNVLQVSSAHVYLTYPFVLSWSFLEAMAAGCLMIGSRTAPVEEVLRDRENGLLVDFFDRDALVDAIDEAIERRGELAPLRARARADVVRDYDLATVCLPRQLGLIDALLARAGSSPSGPAR